MRLSKYFIPIMLFMGLLIGCEDQGYILVTYTPVASEQVATSTSIPQTATWTQAPTLTQSPQATGTETPGPTPTPEYAPVFDGFVLLNDNPDLDNVTIIQVRRGVFDDYTDIAVPAGYTHFWRAGNADGGMDADKDGATIIPVIERAEGLVFDIGGRAAKSGYSVDVEITGITHSNPEPQCLFIQWFATYAIEDDNYDLHAQNYWVHGFADNNRGGQEPLGVYAFDDIPAANVAPFWTIWITANGTYTVTMYLDMRYATAAPNHVEPDNWVSWFLLRSYAVGLDTQGLHCDDRTPML